MLDESIVLKHSKILIVDDQRAARILMRAFFVRLGVARIEEATDELEALRTLSIAQKSGTAFDVVFISRMLRELSGLDLVGSIRRTDGIASLPIVMISEDLNKGYERDAITVGANEYLIRPYTEEQLAEITIRAIGNESKV